jgi:hypothetical protein
VTFISQTLRRSETRGPSLTDGKFMYRTLVTDEPQNLEVTIELDLNHPEIRRLIQRAARNKRSRAVIASGALVVRVK